MIFQKVGHIYGYTYITYYLYSHINVQLFYFRQKQRKQPRCFQARGNEHERGTSECEGNSRAESGGDKLSLQFYGLQLHYYISVTVVLQTCLDCLCSIGSCRRFHINSQDTLTKLLEKNVK